MVDMTEELALPGTSIGRACEGLYLHARSNPGKVFSIKFNDVKVQMKCKE